MAFECAQTDTSTGEGFDIIQARGQEIRITHGEIFENKLIDVSTGESISLHVTGANTVIRNVGFSGLYRGDGYLVSVDAGPGDVHFENVYMGDGATRDGAESVNGPGAVFLSPRNEAALTFSRCNVQGFPNNGFHCSHTATGPGSVHFDTCFGKNNGVATFRCGGSEDHIENCVAYTDDTDYGHDEEYLETNGRPVWVWPGGTVTISESQFADGPYPNAVVAGANDAAGRVSFESGAYRGHIQRATGSTIDIDPDVSNDPDLSIPDGVPRTAETAAGGGALAPSRGALDEQFYHKIVFHASDTAEPSSYAFEATGTVATECHDTPGRDRDIVREQPVRGRISDGTDVYWFRGNVAALTLRGEATVSIQYEGNDPVEPGGSPEL